MKPLIQSTSQISQSFESQMKLYEFAYCYTFPYFIMLPPINTTSEVFVVSKDKNLVRCLTELPVYADFVTSWIALAIYPTLPELIPAILCHVSKQ